MRVSIHIATKDRANEVFGLLQSLRTQTFKYFDIIILDDASGTPLTNFHFINTILNRLRLEGHKTKVIRNNFSKGVCSARQKIVDEDDYDNPLILRLDDDCLPQQDYIERLLRVIKKGYDISTGVIPLFASAEVIRETRFVKPVICKHEIDEKGELVLSKDELWALYDEELVLPCHQFRTNALFKKKVFEKVRYPDNLSKTGFREEGFISLNALLHGFKIGCDVKAVAYHLQTQSGGCRSNEYAENAALDDETFRKWIRKNKEKLKDVLK